MLRHCIEETPRSVEKTEHLATDFLAPGLFVIQNAIGSGEHDDTKLHIKTGGSMREVRIKLNREVRREKNKKCISLKQRI